MRRFVTAAAGVLLLLVGGLLVVHRSGRGVVTGDALSAFIFGRRPHTHVSTAPAPAPAPAPPATRHRRSYVWLIRERGDDLLALFVDDDGDKKRDDGAMRAPPRRVLPSDSSRFMEIPRKAARRVLALWTGIDDLRKVETFTQIRHGKFTLTDGTTMLKDATSYVVFLRRGVALPPLPPNGGALSNRGGGSGAKWESLRDVAEHLPQRYGGIANDDWPTARHFLEPFVLTAGKDPARCLGRPPPGAPRVEIPEYPTVRLGGE